MTPEYGIELIRHALESEVLRWPGVHTRKMFGLPAYLVGGRIFCLLVPGGVVLTRIPEGEREEISARFPESHPFVGHGQPILSWIEVPIERAYDLQPLLPFLRKRYERALLERGSQDRGNAEDSEGEKHPDLQEKGRSR